MAEGTGTAPQASTASIGAQSSPLASPTNALLVSRIESLIQRLDSYAKAEEAKAQSFFSKYWPIVVGVLIAGTRFIH
jgi:hypothetical protein